MTESTTEGATSPVPSAPDAPAQQPAAPEANPEPSLEDIASQFAPPPAEPVRTEPQQMPPAQSTPAPAASTPPPDPQDDPLAFAKWQAEQFAALQQQFQEQQRAFTEQQTRSAREQEIADIQAAVDSIGKTVENANPRQVEGFLHYKYMHDPAFQKIWQNRSVNPTAYNKALSLLAQEYKKDWVQTVDPQLAENQRAMEQSYQGAVTGRTAADEQMQKWRDMPPEDFEAEWARLSGTHL